MGEVVPDGLVSIIGLLCVLFLVVVWMPLVEEQLLHVIVVTLSSLTSSFCSS